MMLSNYFTREQLTFSETATRRCLPNEPGEAELSALQSLCLHLLDPLHVKWYRPLIITSAYRSVEVNRLIGGAVTSQHVRGEAADIRVAGLTVHEVVAMIRRSGFVFDQLIHETSWTHLSFSRTHNRGEVLRAIFAAGRKTQYVRL